MESGRCPTPFAVQRCGMFEEASKARADMIGGSVYALSGEGGWLYYGQVTPDKRVGFFRLRTKQIAEVAAILAAPVMTVLSVGIPSITSALRKGSWKKLGRSGVVTALVEPRPSVQWPVGTLTVTVWTAGRTWSTRVEDPAIQDMEIMAAWDAEAHVPSRLAADFGEEEAPWHVGGPIRRERLIKQEMAARFPDAQGHRLPDDWVPLNVS